VRELAPAFVRSRGAARARDEGLDSLLKAAASRRTPKGEASETRYRLQYRVSAGGVGLVGAPRRACDRLTPERGGVAGSVPRPRRTNHRPGSRRRESSHSPPRPSSNEMDRVPAFASGRPGAAQGAHGEAQTGPPGRWRRARPVRASIATAAMKSPNVVTPDILRHQTSLMAASTSDGPGPGSRLPEKGQATAHGTVQSRGSAQAIRQGG
jgi:hypothetical protein